MNDTLTSLRRSTGAALCTECGKCTAVCPLAACGGFSARDVACQHIEEELHGAGLGIQRCLTCGACELRCPQGVRFTELVRKIRALTHHAGFEPDCPHGGALQALMRIMARGEAQQDRLAFLGDGLRTVPDRGDVFFWTGCAMYYDAFFPELDVPLLDSTRAAIRVLNAAGVVPVVSPQERCCGHDLLWNGDRASFELLARHNVKLVADSGAKTLVTACAECLRTFKLDYEPFLPKQPPRMLHLAQFVAEHLPELKLKGDAPQRLTYQDPCRLGRHLEIYDPPRQALRAVPGVELVEMKHTGRGARCCAGGTWAHCDRYAKQIQVERLREARDTGAEALVLACPKCRIHLHCAMRDPHLAGSATLELCDVADVLARALA